MTRLLFLMDAFWPRGGGTPERTAHLVSGLAESGFEITVVADSAGGLAEEEEFHGCRLLRFPFREAMTPGAAPAFFAATASRFARAIEIVKADLVHIGMLAGPSLVFFWFTRRRSAPPFMATLQRELAVDEPLDDATLTGKTLRGAERIICVSQAVAARLAARVPEVAGRITVVYAGIPPPRHEPAPPRLQPPHLLCLGRLIPGKGFHRALAALPLIAARFPDVRLTVAGDGPERAALERRARASGIADRAQFVGWVGPDQRQSLLEAATLVLLPSRTEGLPLVAVQAAQSGRPVVASAVGGLPEAVSHGETGLLLADLEPTSLAAAVIELLAAPEVVLRMGRDARRRALEMFDLTRSLATYTAIYGDVLAEVSDAGS